MKSKCAILNENHEIEVKTLELPPLRDYDVLVKIEYAGLCGTQIGEILGKRGEDKWLPHLLGHEGSGIVIQIGPKVEGLEPGDHVVCTWMKKNYWASDGGKKYEDTYNAGEITTFQEHSIISENRLVKIPYYVDLLKASLYGCMIPTGAGSLMNILKPFNSNIAIIGLGNIGTAALLAARHLGYDQVTVIDNDPNKEQTAYMLGAKDFKTKLEDKYDFILECTGNLEIMESCTEYLNGKYEGSKVVLTGNPNGKVPIDIRELNAGKVKGSWGGFKDSWHCYIEKFIDDLISNDFNLDGLQYNIYSLDNIQQAIDDFVNGIPGKVIIKP